MHSLPPPSSDPLLATRGILKKAPANSESCINLPRFPYDLVSNISHAFTLGDRDLILSPKCLLRQQFLFLYRK